MSKIIKVYPTDVPAMKFIGMKFTHADRINGTFAHLWQEWKSMNRAAEIFTKTEDLGLEDYDNTSIGLCRYNADAEFEYWIGMFTPLGSEVPEGFSSLDFPATRVMTFHVKGTEPDIYGSEVKCQNILGIQGYNMKLTDGYLISYERYVMSRFMSDEAGDRILDICLVYE